MGYTAALRQRHLVLARDTRDLLSLPLDQGGSWRLVAPELGDIAAVIAALETVPGVAVLPADGGLLGTMPVSGNLALALCYGREVDHAILRAWEQQLQLAFQLCGVGPERMHSLGRELPMRLERLERWLVGLVLRLMRPSEVLVLDRAFAGLSRRQGETVLALASVYQEFHPFRPLLFVDLDAHGLPALPGCCATVELEGQACPS